MKNQLWDPIISRTIAGCLLIVVPLSAASWLSPKASASMSKGVSFNSLVASFEGPGNVAITNKATSDQAVVLDDWTYTSKKMQNMWSGYVQQHGSQHYSNNQNYSNKGSNSRSYGNNSHVDHKSVQFSHYQTSNKHGYGQQVNQNYNQHLRHEVVAFFCKPQSRQNVRAFEQHVSRHVNFFVPVQRHEHKVFHVVQHQQKEHFHKQVAMSACTP